MLTTLVLGLLTTLVAEAVSWVNKKLLDTPLKGNAAWLVAAAISIVAATIKVFHSDVPASWSVFFDDIAKVWIISQIFFIWVVQKFNLDVKAEKPSMLSQKV